MGNLKGITLNGESIDPGIDSDNKPDQDVTEIRVQDEQRKPKRKRKHKKWGMGRRKVIDSKSYSKKEIEIEEIKRKHTDPESGFLVFKLGLNLTAIIRPDGIDIQLR